MGNRGRFVKSIFGMAVTSSHTHATRMYFILIKLLRHGNATKPYLHFGDIAEDVVCFQISFIFLLLSSVLFLS